MFFSPDLLSKRDSGFGLLWLAATLGSKSAFKKLPKRSVMTADISQLCRLIAMPVEPLALRLSSNLLVGAARVYRVKQEIFISDVTTCFNSLKRVEHEFRSMTSEGQLQMAQPSVRSSAVTLRADPRAAMSSELDAMVAGWDEYLNPGRSKDVEDDSNNDYHPTMTRRKEKAATSSTVPLNSEFLRAIACTLPENHGLLLGNSFDTSFGGSGSIKISSPQIGGFGIDDTFDGLDIEEGVGDDLVRELGEGWGASPIRKNPVEKLSQAQEPFGMVFHAGDLDDGTAGLDGFFLTVPGPQQDIPSHAIHDLDAGSVESPLHPPAGTTKSVDLRTPISHSPPVQLAAYEVPAQPGINGVALKKAKRARPMLDVRTELTDEELKATRMYYLDKQNAIRCDLEFKKFERRQDYLIQSLLWGAPDSAHAKELVDFWVNHFRVHVEARSGLVEPRYLGAIPCQKRRKLSPEALHPSHTHIGDKEDAPMLAADKREPDRRTGDGGDVVDFDYDMPDVNWAGDVDDYTPHAKNLRSSEEPGQARRISRPSSVFGDSLVVDVVPDTFHSQRSALFPWDMAGNSSSISARGGVIQLNNNGRMSVEHADARLRGSSTSRRGSSLPSVSNLQAGIGSPAVILPTIQSDDDFLFDVPGDIQPPELQQSETDRVALEKNSHNFLEYAKMQYRSLPSTQYLGFDDIVPKATSTARVAAAALYHCLVLATKDLMQVNQEEPYGRINIRII